MIHDQNRVPGPQHKPSQNIISDERNHGMTAAPKQRQEYQKKDPQSKLVVDPTNIEVPGRANVGPPWATLLLIN